MKKHFDIVEVVKYSHRITIDIGDNEEDDFDNFADDIAESVDAREYDLKEEILNEFSNKYGKESIEFCEDVSPSVEFEAW